MARPARLAVPGADRAFKVGPHVSPATLIGPGEKWLVDRLDWSWVFVVYRESTEYVGLCVGSNGMMWTRRRPGGGHHRPLSSIWKFMNPHEGRKGYLVYNVKVASTGLDTSRFAQGLVLGAFLGPCPAGLQACHWDGNPANNNLYNLRYDTPKNNQADVDRHGRRCRGERRPEAKLTTELVAKIRQTRRDNPSIKQSELAILCGVARGTIANILQGKNWRTPEAGYIEDEPRSRRPGPAPKESNPKPLSARPAGGPPSLTESDIPVIFDLAASGLPLEDIASRFRVHRATISYALNRKTWDHVLISDDILEKVREAKRNRRKPRVLTEFPT